jgi:glycosyltransferase involved in cell wall biosynthesis
MWQRSKNTEREEIYERINKEFGAWKESLYYGLYDLINRDAIFSKLPYLLEDRRKISPFDSQLNFLKGVFILPALFLWRLFLIRLEAEYYRVEYPEVHTLRDVENEDFDYLFVLNTTDHTITVLPVLESMDDKAKSLVVTFKGVYARYKDDFDALKNTKIIFFEYELKNLPLVKYLTIIKESKGKFGLLESQSVEDDVKRLMDIDKNFINFHLKTELIQYYFFEKVFNTFDLKGVVSIVFSTAFELCKERGIPTFVLQHGIGGKGHGHPYVSDYWFTLDEVSKDSLDEWLDRTVEVIAAGSPRFEYLKNHLSMKKDVTRFNKKIGKSGYEKIVTYIGGDEESQVTFQALKSLRKALPECANLIIKLHPRTPLNVLDIKMEMEKILTQKELKHITFIRGEIDFYEVLANSDVVITFASTGMLESIAADIPTIQANFVGVPLPDVYDLSSFGWKEPITDPDFMVDEVLSILSDKKKYEEVIKKQRWLKNRMFTNFDNCGEIIAQRIVDICNKDKR